MKPTHAHRDRQCPLSEKKYHSITLVIHKNCNINTNIYQISAYRWQMSPCNTRNVSFFSSFLFCITKKWRFFFASWKDYWPISRKKTILLLRKSEGERTPNNILNAKFHFLCMKWTKIIRKYILSNTYFSSSHFFHSIVVTERRELSITVFYFQHPFRFMLLFA